MARKAQSDAAAASAAPEEPKDLSESGQLESGTSESQETSEQDVAEAPAPLRCLACGVTLAPIAGRENFTHECPNCNVRFLVLADGTMEATGKGA